MRLGILFGVACVLAPLYGDGPGPDAPRMMDINVVAIDSHGQTVTDLTRDEIRVTDSGHPQTIAFFRLRDNKPTPAQPLAPNEFSNRAAANIPHATLILFDLLNESFSTRGSAASQLVRSLQSLETPDYVYLYLLTVDGRLYAVRGLPGPEGEAEPPGGAAWTSQIKQLVDKALSSVQVFRPVDIDVAVRVQLTYAALDRIAAELSRVPGHKNIVWITDGVPIALGPNRSDTGEVVDFTPLLRQMSEAMDRSGVAIYPVRQVMLGSPNTVDHMGTAGVNSLDTLDEFAELTGGRPDSGKDIGMALRQAMNDARTSYQIGYYPPVKNWDDKYHKLRVACTRKGVHIQAKTGYYAWHDAPGAESEQALNSAVGTTFDAAEIGIRATLSPDPKDARTLRLDAHIDARDVVLVHAGDWYNGELRAAVVGYGPGEKPRPGPMIPIQLHYSAQERDKAMREGISFDWNLPPASDLSLIRLIVFDHGSHAIGSLTLRVPIASSKPQP